MVSEEEAMRALPPQGWLHDYVEFAMKRTDACAAYHIACGLSALTQAGLGVIRFGGIKVPMSLFCLLVGESSTSRKTASINIGAEIVADADPTAIIEKVASKEALVGFLHKHPKRLLVYEEFGAFLAAAERGPLLAMKTALNDCLDMQTEVFTPRGWLRYEDIRSSDLVYSLNKETDELEWVPIQRISYRPVAAGERMFELQTEHHNIRTTEGHIFYVKGVGQQDFYSAFAGAQLAGYDAGFQLPHTTRVLRPSTLMGRSLTNADPGERVWCVTNRNSTIITRRGGKISIIGNCHDSAPLGNAQAKDTREGKNKGIIRDALVSILAGSAPHYLERHTEEVDWRDGFFARFFVIHSKRERTFKMPTDDPATRKRLTQKLTEKIFTSMERKPDPPVFEGLSDEARDLWYAWFDQLEKREQAARFSAAITRAPSFALRIASLLALDYGGILEAERWQIGVEELAPAIAIAELHIKSTCSLGAYIAESPDMARRRSVLSAIDHNKPTPMSTIISRSRLLLFEVQRLLASLQAEKCVSRCDESLESNEGEAHYSRSIQLSDTYTPPELPDYVWNSEPLVPPVEAPRG